MTAFVNEYLLLFFRNNENLTYPFFDWNHRPLKAALIGMMLICVLEIIHLLINLLIKLRTIVYTFGNGKAKQKC